ncbi:MAG: dehydrogenase [Desulfobacterales bacterium]|nr:dehydrogenase [Desulfobacterales bacterium]
MKHVVSISLGKSDMDYELETTFLGQKFLITRIGTDKNIEKAQSLMKKWDGKANVIGLGDVKFPYSIGSNYLARHDTERLMRVAATLKTPVTIGTALRRVAYEWSIRHVNFQLGKGNYFKNSRVLFLSGMFSYSMAKVMSEYTDNLTFADPLLESGIPTILTSLEMLEGYASGIHEITQWLPTKYYASWFPLSNFLNSYIIKKAVKNAHIIVIPYQDFHKYIEGYYTNELWGKTVITSTAYDEKVNFLKDRGVEVIIDATPKVLERVVAINVLESLIIAALEKPIEKITDDDLLEIISSQKMDPRVIYPFGKVKRVNRFACIIPSQYSKEKSLNRFIPKPISKLIEKVNPFQDTPFIYSKVTGIKSITGVEAEGWIICLVGDWNYKQLIRASKIAKKLGVQIIGLEQISGDIEKSSILASKYTDTPITTGWSYKASVLLKTMIDVFHKAKSINLEEGKKIKAKLMITGATGHVGFLFARIFSKMFDEIYMVDTKDARLLHLKTLIMEEIPDAKIFISTRADKNLSDMDAVFLSTSTGKKIHIDIMSLKAGCIVIEATQSEEIKSEDSEKRKDIIVIKSGNVELPGLPEMKDIGFPQKTIPVTLAEAIVLALEGRFETYTTGDNLDLNKIEEIYKISLKHGFVSNK